MTPYTIKEIKENEYNLNIARYVNTFEKENIINIAEEKRNLEDSIKKSKEIDAELAIFFKELGI